MPLGSCYKRARRLSALTKLLDFKLLITISKLAVSIMKAIIMLFAVALLADSVFGSRMQARTHERPLSSCLQSGSKLTYNSMSTIDSEGLPKSRDPLLAHDALLFRSRNLGHLSRSPPKILLFIITITITIII